ncbi:unnamed protein product, partial [Staurois parvus]
MHSRAQTGGGGSSTGSMPMLQCSYSSRDDLRHVRILVRTHLRDPTRELPSV